jgi:hypothetical protein
MVLAAYAVLAAIASPRPKFKVSRKSLLDVRNIVFSFVHGLPNAIGILPY